MISGAEKEGEAGDDKERRRQQRQREAVLCHRGLPLGHRVASTAEDVAGVEGHNNDADADTEFDTRLVRAMTAELEMYESGLSSLTTLNDGRRFRNFFCVGVVVAAPCGAKRLIVPIIETIIVPSIPNLKTLFHSQLSGLLGQSLLLICSTSKLISSESTYEPPLECLKDPSHSLGSYEQRCRIEFK